MVNVIVGDVASSSYEQNSKYFAELDSWAQENIGSKYMGYHVQDVSDVSLMNDEIACYQFVDDASASWFKLRWI